ncbi:MAG TPA: hypothetical protein VMW06_04715 [Desulfobacterales bacterium]|nr:hypothetical protein [Desulfobacterales bacterium]
MEAIGRTKLLDGSEINRCISEALSLITTSSQGAMKMLINNNLI